MKKLFICLLFIIGLASASSVKDNLQFFDTDYILDTYYGTYPYYSFSPINIPLYNSSDNMVISTSMKSCTVDNANFHCSVYAPLFNLYPHNIQDVQVYIGPINYELPIPYSVNITLNLQYSIAGVAFNKSITYNIQFMNYNFTYPIMFSTSPLNVQSSYNGETQYFMECTNSADAITNVDLQLDSGSSDIKFIESQNQPYVDNGCILMYGTINDNSYYTLSGDFKFSSGQPSQESSTEIHLIY